MIKWLQDNAAWIAIILYVVLFIALFYPQTEELKEEEKGFNPNIYHDQDEH